MILFSLRMKEAVNEGFLVVGVRKRAIRAATNVCLSDTRQANTFLNRG